MFYKSELILIQMYKCNILKERKAKRETEDKA